MRVQSAITKLIIVGFFSMSAFSSSNTVTIAPGKVHVPKGFDANDKVEVIVIGELPNTCYRRPFGEVKIIDNNISIEMRATKLTDPDVLCMQVAVPYMVSIPLGQLEEGNYLVATSDSDYEKNGVLVVSAPNSASIDNFNYANVTSIDKISLEGILEIKGVHPSSCMVLDRVELIPNDKEDTFAVLPIVRQTEEECDRVMKPFVYELSVPTTITEGVVFHVRRLDGTAMNYLW